MSALPPKADSCSAPAHVRFVPIADIGCAAANNDAALAEAQLTEVRPPVLPEDQPLIGKMISNLAPPLTPDIAVIRPS